MQNLCVLNFRPVLYFDWWVRKIAVYKLVDYDMLSFSDIYSMYSMCTNETHLQQNIFNVTSLL